MTTATIRNRLKRLERAAAESAGDGQCPTCRGRGVLEVFLGEDDPSPHPGCAACGRILKVLLVEVAGGTNEPPERAGTPERRAEESKARPGSGGEERFVPKAILRD